MSDFRLDGGACVPLEAAERGEGRKNKEGKDRRSEHSEGKGARTRTGRIEGRKE